MYLMIREGLRIDSRDGKILVLLLSGMPDHVKEVIFAQLMLINEEEFVEISSQDTVAHGYKAFHFDWYFRYADKVPHLA